MFCFVEVRVSWWSTLVFSLVKDPLVRSIIVHVKFILLLRNCVTDRCVGSLLRMLLIVCVFMVSKSRELLCLVPVLLLIILLIGPRSVLSSTEVIDRSNGDELFMSCASVWNMGCVVVFLFERFI